MKKLIITILLFIFTVPVFAYSDYGAKEGDVFILLVRNLVVRDDVPNEFNQTRPVATLPIGTSVTIKEIDGDWGYIEWYSNTNKIYKQAWTFIPAVCTSALACNYEAAAERSMLQVLYSINNTESATTALNNNEFNKAIELATKAINAQCALDSLVNKTTHSISHDTELLAINYQTRSRAYYEVGQIENAIKDATESIYYKPQNLSAYVTRALSYEMAGYYSKAKEDYLKVKTYAIAERNEKTVIYINKHIKELNELINQAK